MRLLSVAAILLAAAPSIALAQQTQATAAPAAAQSAPAQQTQAAPAAPAPAANPLAMPYTYNAEGRRDPFQSLLAGPGNAKTPPKTTAAGIAGIHVDEVAVRGIMQSREKLVAMVQGPDNRTYLVHQGDKLADGAVKTITPLGIVLIQDVSDPRAKETTREVRKLLRTPEDEKE